MPSLETSGTVLPSRSPASGRFHVRTAAGFTMVELVIVILLVGILGAIGAGRFFSRGGFDAAAYSEQAAAMLRFGQKLAIAQNRPVYMQVLKDSGGTYTALALCYSAGNPCASADQVPATGGGNSDSKATRAACVARGWYCEGVPAGSTLRLGTNSPTRFYFNGLGRPYLNGDDAQASTFQAFTVYVAGDDITRTVSVSPETGYVY
jgi:MSHA pilin protein MshC